MALEHDDHVYSGHRSHAHYLAKGGDLDAMIAELHGRATGCTGGWGGSMHLMDEAAGLTGSSPVVGDAISLAIGSAMAFKLDGSGRVAMACFGDSGVETGQFWEAASFAALHKLPVMFFCENNQYATATHISMRQPAGEIYERVKGFMWSYQVEDSDVEAVYQAAQECRKSQPGFLEVSTYRYREHVGPSYDWDMGYRTEQEVRQHEAKDNMPVVRAKIGDQAAGVIEKEIEGRVIGAFERALAAPWPEMLA
jgi:pyruvate dehydrogenase E1 component alpha subunit